MRHKFYPALIPEANQKRHVTQVYQQKEAEAQQQWQNRYEEIKAGRRQSNFNILRERGYINAVAGLVGIRPKSPTNSESNDD